MMVWMDISITPLQVHCKDELGILLLILSDNNWDDSNVRCVTTLFTENPWIGVGFFI